MGEPKSSFSRSAAPHSSQCTAANEEIGALQARQRLRSSPPHCGHLFGTSLSNSSNHRRAAPHETQKATQCPSTFLRSSRIQSDALPTRATLPRR
jgi:hypothetical protein